MKQLQIFFSLAMCCVALSLPAQQKKAAATASAAAASTVPAVMLSDLHFDPYNDPAKFEQLRKAPISEWRKILAGPDAPTQLVDAKKLMAQCGMRGADSSPALLEGSLNAAHAHSPHAQFVTVSGDLMAHSFDCRFRLLAKGATSAESSEFAAKTVAYVASELHRVFAPAPVYLALGNNDSGCGDYRESSNSDFLRSVGASVGDDVESPEESKDVLQVFPANGDYSVALPKPIVRGRLIVLQNIFLSAGFAGCNGKPDAAAGTAQLEWLRAELTAARARNEQVWVMAHIPPGVNFYTTLSRDKNSCQAQAPATKLPAPVMFLRDEKLVDVLTDFAPEIRLAIFAHTHMDEMRLLQVGTAKVAAKLVPSVSPINGNSPTFTLADVDMKTAVLKDYRVFSADNKTGVGATWREDYRYSDAFHSTGFTADEVGRLMEKFAADKEGNTTESMMYQGNFMVGGGLRSLAIRLVWPSYVCSMRYNTAKDFQDCLCPVKP